MSYQILYPHNNLNLVLIVLNVLIVTFNIMNFLFIVNTCFVIIIKLNNFLKNNHRMILFNLNNLKINYQLFFQVFLKVIN